MGFEQRRGLSLGAGPDVVGVHVAVRVQIQAVPAALGRGAFPAAVAAAEQAAAFLAGLPGQILHPTQGDAVVGEAARIGRVVGKAALPAGGEGMGQLKGVGHAALLGGLRLPPRKTAAWVEHAKKSGARKTERFQ